MKKTVLDIISRLNENLDVEIREHVTSELLSYYDGKNSIDEEYNNCEVHHVLHIKEDNLFIIYVLA